MSELEIQSWNVSLGNTTSGGRNTYVPFVTVKPSLEFLAQARANDNIVYVKISDSGIYDGGYRAVLEPAYRAPCTRPNFSAATGLYALTLIDAEWDGYPPNGATGKVTLSDGIVLPGHGYVVPNEKLKDEIEEITEELAEKMESPSDDPPPPTPDPTTDTSSTPWYVWVIVAVIIALVFGIIILQIIRGPRGPPGRGGVYIGPRPPPPPPHGGHVGLTVNI